MENRQELLTNLYTLRAGLSALSQNKDSVKAMKEKTDRNLQQMQWDLRDELKEHAKECCAYVQEDVEEVRKILTGEDDGIEQIMRSHQYEKAVKACSDRIDEVRMQSYDDSKKCKRKWISLRILSIFLFLAVCGIACLHIFGKDYLNSLPTKHGVLTMLVYFFSGVASIVCFICSIVAHHHARDWKKSMKSDLDNLVKYTYMPDREKHFLERGQQTLEQYRECRQNANNFIAPRVQLHKATYNALLDSFGGMLDPRDWPYLDLIIYYVETDRAGTIREALQQLDRERQTQQIIGSIKMATKAICRTIQSEMSALRSTIQTGFASLQSSIDSGFAKMNAIGQAQLEQMSLANALRAKANTTSEQLMNDISYMKKKLTY